MVQSSAARSSELFPRRGTCIRNVCSSLAAQWAPIGNLHAILNTESLSQMKEFVWHRLSVLLWAGVQSRGGLSQVSQDDDYPEGRGGATAAGPSGRRGRLSLSCAQQAPKASHPSAGAL